MCRPYGFRNHADMTETALRSITNSGIWIPMLSPTCSTMISSDEPRCRGFNQSRIQFPLSIGMLLARDLIVGIPIPRSISLRASHFTRSVMHDPVTNYLVTLSSLWWCITERVKRLASNEIELGIEIPMIESRASNIPLTKGTTYVVMRSDR